MLLYLTLDCSGLDRVPVLAATICTVDPERGWLHRGVSTGWAMHGEIS